MRVAMRVVTVVVALAVLTGCSDAEPDTSPALEPLAKVEGWRVEVQDWGDIPYGLVEIAADVDTAQRAWQENVPDHLGEADASQGEPGVYGSIDDVDFTRQVVVVWHSGQSGSCPGWLADITTQGDGVALELGEYVPADGCTDDYNAYRMVLAVDRDRLSDLADLPTDDVTIDGIADGRLSNYPDEALTDQGG